MLLQILETATENQNSEELMSFVQKQIERNQRMEFISFLVPILIILLIVIGIKCKHKDEEVGMKGAGIASFLTTSSIILAILLIIYVWFSNYKMNIINEIILMGMPFVLAFISQSFGIFSAIKLTFLGLFRGLILFIIMKVLGIFIKPETIYLIEKVVTTLLTLMIFSKIKEFSFKGWHRGKILIKRPKKTYSSYSGAYSSGYSSSSSSNNTPDIFGSDVKIEYNMLTGKNEYYQNGKLIATSEKGPISGDEYIRDMNGNTIMTKKEGFFNDYVYQDSKGNTIYKENHDYLTGGSNITDNNYKNVASHDPWNDIFNTGKNYTSKK